MVVENPNLDRNTKTINSRESFDLEFVMDLPPRDHWSGENAVYPPLGFSVWYTSFCPGRAKTQ